MGEKKRNQCVTCGHSMSYHELRGEEYHCSACEKEGKEQRLIHFSKRFAEASARIEERRNRKARQRLGLDDGCF